MKLPVHEDDVETQTWYAGTEREISALALCDIGGRAKIGFGICMLSPGCTTQPAHYHTLEDEHLYVLEGSGKVHLGEQQFELRKGSYVHFPAGQRVHHYVSNDSTEMLRYIMVGERIAEDEVIYAS